MQTTMSNVSTQPPSPADTAKALQLLGIATAKVGVYGVGHPASRDAIHAAFVDLQPILAAHRVMELSTDHGELLVDGRPLPVDPVLGRLLASQMARHGRVGLALSHPLCLEELTELVVLMAQPPAPGSAQETSIAKHVDDAGWKSIRMVKGHYVRVDGESGEGTAPAPAAAPVAPRPPARASESVASGSGPRVVDLSLDLALGNELAETLRVTPASKRRPDALDERIDADKLDTLVKRLQQVAALLEGRFAAMPDEGETIVHELLGNVQTVTRTARERVQLLAADLAVDRPAVGRLEAEALRRGVALRQTRDALLARLAELHQELLQPLTVASGVLESMISGSLGPVSLPQQSMLQLAFESIGAVSDLAEHVTELVGYPAGLRPTTKPGEPSVGVHP